MSFLLIPCCISRTQGRFILTQLEATAQNVDRFSPFSKFNLATTSLWSVALFGVEIQANLVDLLFDNMSSINALQQVPAATSQYLFVVYGFTTCAKSVSQQIAARLNFHYIKGDKVGMNLKPPDLPRLILLLSSMLKLQG